MKVQEKLENKRNRIALNVAIIGALSVIIGAIIPLFKNSSTSSSKQNIEIKNNQNSPISRDIGTQNNYFLNASNDTNKRTDIILTTERKTKVKRTFKISPSDPDLERMLSEDNYILSKRDIRFFIEITFNGDIEKVEENLYRYNGGNILIKINGKTCFIFNDLIITPTFNGGNNKQNVLNEINEKINELISRHTKTIYTKIIQCLK